MFSQIISINLDFKIVLFVLIDQNCSQFKGFATFVCMKESSSRDKQFERIPYAILWSREYPLKRLFRGLEVFPVET